MQTAAFVLRPVVPVPASRRSAWTVAAAVVLVAFGGALVAASVRAGSYVGPVAFGAGVAEIAVAGLLLLRIHGAGSAAVLASTVGLVFSGIALLAALTARDPFVALGGAGGETKNLVAGVAVLAIGYGAVLVGGRRAP